MSNLHAGFATRCTAVAGCKARPIYGNKTNSGSYCATPGHKEAAIQTGRRRALTAIVEERLAIIEPLLEAVPFEARGVADEKRYDAVALLSRPVLDGTESRTAMLLLDSAAQRLRRRAR